MPPNYRSTYPVTPYAPGYDPGNDLSNPDWTNYVFEQKRRKLEDELKNKKQQNQANPAMNPDLPKKFVPNQEKVSSGQKQPPKPLPKPRKESKISDPGLIPTKLPSAVKAPEEPAYGFNLQTPETPEMVLPPVMGQGEKPVQDYAPESLAPQTSAIRNNVAGYMPSSTQAMPQMGGGSPDESGDFRTKLYEYLRRKIGSPAIDADRLNRMGQARADAATNQFGALLADSSSKMGTLQGKRADVANFQPLIKAVYDRDMGEIQDEMALENEREDSLLKGASLSSKILKSTSPKPPKVLPYYRAPTKDQPGEILMYDEEGKFMPRQLPPGYEPNNPWSTLPPFVDASGNPVFMQQNPVTGETRKLDLPNDLRSLEQVKIATQEQMKEIDRQIKTASEAERNNLMRERMRLSTQLAQIRQKELEMRMAKQAQDFKLEKEKFEQEKKTQDWREKNAAEKLQIEKEKAAAKAAGKGPGGAKLTEGERTAGLQASVAASALATLEQMESKGYRPGLGTLARKSVGVISPSLQNYLTPENEQIYQDTNLSLIDQLLRAASGAAVPEIEVRRAMETYAIQPGDGPRTIANKQKMRRVYVQGLIDKAGNAGIGKSLPQKPGRSIIKKFHDKANNRTKYLYNDGTEEVVNGLR